MMPWHHSTSPWSQERRRWLPGGWSQRGKEQIRPAEKGRSPVLSGRGRDGWRTGALPLMCAVEHTSMHWGDSIVLEQYPNIDKECLLRTRWLSETSHSILLDYFSFAYDFIS